MKRDNTNIKIPVITITETGQRENINITQKGLVKADRDHAKEMDEFTTAGNLQAQIQEIVFLKAKKANIRNRNNNITANRKKKRRCKRKSKNPVLSLLVS